MSRLLLILVLGALVLPAGALGKGPSEARITGPGLGKTIVLSGTGDRPGVSAITLAVAAGFSPAAFGWDPSPMLEERPDGELGPRYTITYRIPMDIKQYVYPYADPPVTYMPPGQDLYGADGTKGGWFRGDAQLRATLVSAGLPEEAPGGSRAEPGSFPTGLVGLLGAALLLGAATTFVLRRRARPATATLLAIAALAIPAAASAKGPASASIDGPGIGAGINVPGAGENVGTPLGDLAHYTGFFPAVYGSELQDPMSKDRPKGDLGPRYTVTYSLPMGEETVEIRQDMYPYANPPVTYTKPGQKVYEGRETPGGWYTAGIPALRVRLIEAGLLPSTPPAGGSAVEDGALPPTETLLAIAAAMGLVLAGTAVFLRRRTRPAATA